MPEKEIVIRDLRREVERTDKKTERECGNLLKDDAIAWVLLAPAHGRPGYVKSNFFTSAGMPDLVVIAEMRPAGGESYKVAYLWELKAPQVPLFKLEGDGIRGRPSDKLYEAENQLLHYFDRVMRDGGLLEEWGVSSRHVELGGIIIGRDDSLVECKSAEVSEATKLANKARSIRETHIYSHLSLTLWTWDTVLHYAQTQTAGYQIRIGDGSSRQRMIRDAGIILDRSGTSLPSTGFSFYTGPLIKDPEE